MEMRKIEQKYPTTRAKFPWTDKMGEISGFGGGYEETCRNMLYGFLAYNGHESDCAWKRAMGLPAEDRP
jgi:hypothetical protein